MNVRRLTDIVLAVILAGISLPLMVLGVLAVLSCGRSPFLFQERIGFLGRPFLLFKIRTLDGPYGIQNRGVLDRAFIFLSIVLRRTKIDELPQLLNVIRGEMTLIGPRPLLADDLQSMPPNRAQRQSVVPGLTGLAQVLGGQTLAPAEKLGLDLLYIRHRGIRLDVWIIARTMITLSVGERLRKPPASAIPVWARRRGLHE